MICKKYMSKKALGFWGVSIYQYDSLIILVKNLVLIIVYNWLFSFKELFDLVELKELRNTL